MAVDPVIKLDAQLLKRPLKADAKAAEPIELDSASQLFADDHLIEHSESLYRRLNRPKKSAEPFLVADKPWEGEGIVYGSIVEHDGEYRLYYKGWRQAEKLTIEQHLKKHGRGKFPICLARSRDALSFSKEPLKDAVHPNTNIVIDDPIDDFTVCKDPDDPDPQQRFKLLASRGNWWAGLTPATSPDGIRWTWGEDHAVAFFGDRCSYCYDPLKKKHIAWSRNYQLLGGRVIVHKETADFRRWNDVRESHPKLVMQPDRYDHEQSWFYGGYPFWYQSLYFAYLEVYYIHLQRLDTQLACSRDGHNWTRLCQREVFLPNGEHGAFDAYWIVPTFNPPIARDGRLLIHYNGRPDPHTQPGFSHIPPGMGGAFGLATLREDGFVSLDATGTQGVLETKVLQPPANWQALELNVCPFRTGGGSDPMRVQVDVLSASGEPLCGYALTGSSDDELWRRIEPEQRPATLKLRLRMTNARLYSVRFR